MRKDPLRRVTERGATAAQPVGDQRYDIGRAACAWTAPDDRDRIAASRYPNRTRRGLVGCLGRIDALSGGSARLAANDAALAAFDLLAAVFRSPQHRYAGWLRDRCQARFRLVLP